WAQQNGPVLRPARAHPVPSTAALAAGAALGRALALRTLGGALRARRGLSLRSCHGSLLWSCTRPSRAGEPYDRHTLRPPRAPTQQTLSIVQIFRQASFARARAIGSR